MLFKVSPSHKRFQCVQQVFGPKRISHIFTAAMESTFYAVVYMYHRIKRALHQRCVYRYTYACVCPLIHSILLGCVVVCCLIIRDCARKTRKRPISQRREKLGGDGAFFGCAVRGFYSCVMCGLREYAGARCVLSLMNSCQRRQYRSIVLR